MKKYSRLLPVAVTNVIAALKNLGRSCRYHICTVRELSFPAQSKSQDGSRFMRLFQMADGKTPSYSKISKDWLIFWGHSIEEKT